MMQYFWGPMFGLGGFGFFGMFWMFFFWILVIVGIIMLLNRREDTRGKKEDRSPMDTLKDRYAKGEIDKKEYEEKKKDILKD